jgi:hypothetical protein
MDKDARLMVEAYVDGITKRRGELAGNIMDIVRYGIPTKEEFIKIRQELHDKTKQILDRGTPATEEERARGKQLMGMIRSYRAQHPDDPPVAANLHHAEENAESVQQQFTMVSGGTDNASEHGFDINPVEHIAAADLKDAVEQMMHSDDYDDDTWDPEFREYKKDYFVMSTDGGDWVYVFPGQLNDAQAYDRVLATGDYGANEDEQGRSRAQQAAIAIALQKAGKKPS